MNPDRWRRIEEVYHAALERSPKERDAFLANACQGDAGLRQEIESLLAQQSGSLLDGQAWEQAPSLFDRKGLVSGAQLGPYRVTGAIGSGGMGEVYKARDTRLGRDVAIKVLPEHLARDTQARARFEREAKAVAALNHSHICALYDVGPDYLVMELVEGPTLAERIARSAIPLEEALAIARQIAEALEAAHEKGIVHRDLKPANIKLTPQGSVKVLDFGLATVARGTSAAFDDPENSPTRTNTLSREGVILGTAAYMAPEQARGEVVDKRADIWAFGVILYEMLTGKRLFGGETTTAILAAVLTKEPDLARVPAKAQPLLRSCLEKDPKRRLRDIGEAWRQLEDLVRSVAARRGQRERWWVMAGTLGLVFIAASVVAWSLWNSRVKTTPNQPNLHQLTHDDADTGFPALSPDAKLVAYQSDRAEPGRYDIWVQQTSGGPALRLTKGPADYQGPVFSADGSKIYFWRLDGGIYELPTLGGEARLIAANGYFPRVSPDGQSIAYMDGSQGELYVLHLGGGAPHQAAPGYSMASFHPIWSPDGRQILFFGGQAIGDWRAVPSDGGTPERTGWYQQALNRKAWQGGVSDWLPGDVLIFWETIGDTTRIYRARFARRDWRALGGFEALTLGTGIDKWPSVSAGKMTFQSGASTEGVWSLPANTNLGRVTGSIEKLTAEKAPHSAASLTPDGTTLVFCSKRTDATDIYLRDMRTGEERVLVADRNLKVAPLVSADGSKVVYTVLPSDSVYAVPTAGGPPRKICDDCGFPRSLSPDGKWFLANPATGTGITVTNMEPGQSTVVLQHSRYGVDEPRFSPDGKWIAFRMPREGLSVDFVVAPFRNKENVPDRDWITVASVRGDDSSAFWSPNGDVLYYYNRVAGQSYIMAQRVDRSRHPAGVPFRVYQFSGRVRPSLALGNVSSQFTAVPGRIVGAMRESTSNIWMMDLPK